MTPHEINQRLTDIRNTLNLVSVAGADNMNRLLGCILALDKLQPEIAAMTRPEPEEEVIIDAADQTD